MMLLRAMITSFRKLWFQLIKQNLLKKVCNLIPRDVLMVEFLNQFKIMINYSNIFKNLYYISIKTARDIVHMLILNKEKSVFGK